MKFLRAERVSLADLKVNMFVREELDHDHVLYLAGLIDANVKMKDNIWATPEHHMIAGRHRKEAYELAGHKEVDVDIYVPDNELDHIAAAYKENTGGSKPPTISDTEHTIGLMIERGASARSIAELLGLPGSLTRKYVAEVKSKLDRAKLVRAATAVTEGNLTVQKAAEQFGADPEKLKELLSGSRKREKRGNGIAEMQRALTKLYRGAGQKNSVLCRRLIEKFEDADMSSKEVLAVFSHLEKLQAGSARAIAEWKTRFAAKAGIEIKPKRKRSA